VTLNGFEDGIRPRPGEAGPNILSGFFGKPWGGETNRSAPAVTQWAAWRLGYQPPAILQRAP